MKNRILSGELFTIHKKAGKLRATCKLVGCKNDIPEFLLASGAVSADDKTITMVAVEGSASREYPVFLSWEETDKLPGGYGAWPKDNGATTLVVDADGKCYDMAPNLTAALLVGGKPLNEHFANMECVNVEDGDCKVLASWGEVRTVPMPNAEGVHTGFIVEYGENDINLVTLSEPAAAEYIVVDENGNDVGYLLDIIS